MRNGGVWCATRGKRRYDCGQDKSRKETRSGIMGELTYVFGAADAPGNG
jgi:hypothetical protein